MSLQEQYRDHSLIGGIAFCSKRRAYVIPKSRFVSVEVSLTFAAESTFFMVSSDTLLLKSPKNVDYTA
jgi:hypothetical protein